MEGNSGAIFLRSITGALSEKIKLARIDSIILFMTAVRVLMGIVQLVRVYFYYICCSSKFVTRLNNTFFNKKKLSQEVINEN